MIEKIKAEIERLIDSYKSAKKFGDANMLRTLLSFIESLEKEQDVDLEKELKQWRHEHFKGKRDGDYNGEYLERESQLDLARYIYELGKNGK